MELSPSESPRPSTPKATGKGLWALYLLFATFIACSVLLTQHLDRVDLTTKSWSYRATVPALVPLGADLRIFIEASQKMYYRENPLGPNYNSPPFTAVVFFPFILMSYEAAYRTMFFLTIALNLGALFLLARLAYGAFPGLADPENRPFSPLDLAIPAAFFTAGINQFFGYPFEFALERGNYDSLGLFASLVGLWLSFRYSKGVWLQVLAFSFAAHLKVYPALLLVLPLWQHRLRAVPPVLILNSAMLFYFGYDRGKEFLIGLYEYAQHPYIWIGNHSAASFSFLVMEPWLSPALPKSWLHAASMTLLVGIPLALWGCGMWRLFRHGYSRWGAFLAAALSIPLMSILTSVSHDYKLVIMIVPAFVCVMHFTQAFLESRQWIFWVGLALTLLAMLHLSRSILLPPLLITVNKYPAVLLLEVLTFCVVWREIGLKTSRPT